VRVADSNHTTMINAWHRATLLLLAGTSAVALAATAPAYASKHPAHAARSHDGYWSVLITTDRGACDASYRYALRIADGQVLYGGEGAAPANVSGHVNSGGQVTVSVAGGQGRSGPAARGVWRGSGSQAGCAGRWVAERRG
jgi:hypothetical protein